MKEGSIHRMDSLTTSTIRRIERTHASHVLRDLSRDGSQLQRCGMCYLLKGVVQGCN